MHVSNRLPSAVLSIEDKSSLRFQLTGAKASLKASKAEVKNWERQVRDLNKKLGKKAIKKSV